MPSTAASSSFRSGLPHGETPTLRAAALTGLIAAVAGVALAILLVLVSGVRGSVLDVARAGVRAWLVSQGSGITVDGVGYSAVPLGAMLLAVLVVLVVARTILADPVDDVWLFAAGTAGAHGILAAVASSLTSTSHLGTGVVRAAFGALLVGGVGAVAAAVMRERREPLDDTHGTHDASRSTDVMPLPVRVVLAAGLRGVAVLLSSALLLVVLLLAVHLPRAGDLWASLDPGVGGGIALLLGSLLVVPNLVLWATSALLGPGFAMGPGTSVDLTGAHLGAVPGLPVLAALPSPGEFPGWVFVLGLVPVLAGAWAGWTVRVPRPCGHLERLAWGAGAGAVGGLLTGLLVACSRGAIGPGRLATAGPPLWTPALAAIGVLAVGGLLGSALAVALEVYRGPRADDAPAG